MYPNFPVQEPSTSCSSFVFRNCFIRGPKNDGWRVIFNDRSFMKNIVVVLVCVYCCCWGGDGRTEAME